MECGLLLNKWDERLGGGGGCLSVSLGLRQLFIIKSSFCKLKVIFYNLVISLRTKVST